MYILNYYCTEQIRNIRIKSKNKIMEPFPNIK